MATKQIFAEELKEFDTIVMYGFPYIVADIRENGRMDGIWVQYTTDLHCTGAAIFLNYDDTVTIIVDADSV